MIGNGVVWRAITVFREKSWLRTPTVPTSREMALTALKKEDIPEEMVTLTWAPGSSGYVSCRFRNASGGTARQTREELPKDIDDLCERYFAAGEEICLADRAKFGWYSGKFDAQWERV